MKSTHLFLTGKFYKIILGDYEGVIKIWDWVRGGYFKKIITGTDYIYDLDII
jgi:hypothetical protein